MIAGLGSLAVTSGGQAEGAGVSQDFRNVYDHFPVECGPSPRLLVSPESTRKGEVQSEGATVPEHVAAQTVQRAGSLREGTPLTTYALC